VPAPALLYTKTGCAFCDAARADLAARGIPMREINLSDRPQSVTELLKLTGGRRVVPVIVEGGVIAVAPDGGSEI
jgi:glutaredoxin 3